jgi:hypothetical protein
LCNYRKHVGFLGIRSVNIILEQWLELKTHFATYNTQEKCYASRTLETMYKDDSLFLYLTFLRPALKDLHDVNIFFQHTNADLYKAFESLLGLILNICRILKPAVKNWSPTVCLNQVRTKLEDFPLEMRNDDVLVDELEAEWRNLLTINWEREFNMNLTSDPVIFWSYVNVCFLIFQILL